MSANGDNPTDNPSPPPGPQPQTQVFSPFVHSPLGEVLSGHGLTATSVTTTTSVLISTEKYLTEPLLFSTDTSITSSQARSYIVTNGSQSLPRISQQSGLLEELKNLNSSNIMGLNGNNIDPSNVVMNNNNNTSASRSDEVVPETVTSRSVSIFGSQESTRGGTLAAASVSDEFFDEDNLVIDVCGETSENEEEPPRKMAKVEPKEPKQEPENVKPPAARHLHIYRHAQKPVKTEGSFTAPLTIPSPAPLPFTPRPPYYLANHPMANTPASAPPFMDQASARFRSRLAGTPVQRTVYRATQVPLIHPPSSSFSSTPTAAHRFDPSTFIRRTRGTTVGATTHPTETSACPTVNMGFRVFMQPQTSKTSKNLDYVAGVKGNSIDGDYYVFCRDKKKIPFEIVVDPKIKKAAKIKIQVVFDKIKNPVLRCANHQEENKDSPDRKQFFTIDEDLPFAYLDAETDGSGCVINTILQRVQLTFGCRNSCHVKLTKTLRLEFSLLSAEDEVIAKREMSLRVCQVPLRDIHRDGLVKHQVLRVGAGHILQPLPPNPEEPRTPGRVKTEAVEYGEQLATQEDVYTLYIQGHESYTRMLTALKAEEDSKRLQPFWHNISPQLSNWTRQTPIDSLLAVACGPIEAVNASETFRVAGLHTLGDVARKFDAQLLPSLHLTPSISTSIASVFLNWYNILIFHEQAASSR